MAQCRLPRGLVFLANAVDHDCRNEARLYLRRAENCVLMMQLKRRVKGKRTDRSTDLTRRSIRTLIAKLRISPVPTESTAQPRDSVPDRHQTIHHPARTSIGAGAGCGCGRARSTRARGASHVVMGSYRRLLGRLDLPKTIPPFVAAGIR